MSKMQGDITLCVVTPDFLNRLAKAGRKYDEALRISGIKRASLAEDRNQADGEVYEARKAFNSILAEARGANK